MRVMARGRTATEQWFDDVWSRSRHHWVRMQSWWATQNFLRSVLPLLLVVGVTLAYFVQFELLVWQRHANFGSLDYDLGMYDQGIWQLAHGRSFMTIRGMDVFGHHANLGYLLFVPFYWLGAGPQFLDFVNTLGVVAVAWPVYLLGRFHLKSRWAGFWLVIAYLGHFAPQWKIQETFHPESIAAPLIVGAFYLATRGRWRGYWWCVFGALIWKEDVSLVVFVLGFLVFFMFKDRWRGLLTIAAGTVWFIVATKLFMPMFQQSGAVFDNLFGSLGANVNEVAWNSIRDPTRLGQVLYEHKAQQGALDLMKPYGYTGIVSPHVLMLGVPQHVINFASLQTFTEDLRHHYAFFPYIAVLLASIRTVVTRRRVAICWALIAVMVGGVLLTRNEGIGPWSTQYHMGDWGSIDSSTPAGRAQIQHNQDLSSMMEKIPDDARVSTLFYMVPHLSHREYIYKFPNPWIGLSYGVNGIPKPPNPDTIDTLLVDELDVCPPDKPASDNCRLYRSIVDSGQFRQVERKDDLVLWRRNR
jgi:uncharacterized membrane protein